MAEFNKDKFKSGSDERETPNNIFEPLNNEFGFTLDVAASDKNKKCNRYFDEKTNALNQEWTGEVCWMNPPYGNKLRKFVRKAYNESKKGCIVVGLIPVKSNTIWWHECVIGEEIRFIKGRPKFNNMKYGYPFPLAIVVWGKMMKKFKSDNQ